MLDFAKKKLEKLLISAFSSPLRHWINGAFTWQVSVSLSFIQRGVEWMPTNWASASAEKKKRKRKHTQVINFCSETLAINKLNITVPFWANTVSSFNNLRICGWIRDKNWNTSALLIKKVTSQLKSGKNAVF